MVKEGLEDIFASPVDLDPTLAHFCISGAGPDRMGTVANMARAISDAGGNVTTSKMVRLGQEFITLMHVAIEPEKRDGLVASLRDKEELKLLNIRASGLRRRETGSYRSAVVGLKIHVVGPDR
jgi:glycine cleavage system regulatory protein